MNTMKMNQIKLKTYENGARGKKYIYQMISILNK